MTGMSLKEARERGLCTRCYGSGRISASSEDDIMIDDAMPGVIQANAVLRFTTCPACKGKGKIEKEKKEKE